MLIFLNIINNILGTYFNSLRKSLAKEKITPLTIIHAPNLIGHPIGIIGLIILGLFALPNDPNFFLFWFALICTAAISSVLTIYGLLETSFFGVEVVGKLGFAVNSILAVLFLGEHLNHLQIFSIFTAVLGVFVFTWPKKVSGKLFKIDRGLAFIILSVILGGFSSVFYKISSFNVPNYATFLSGRFVVDLIVWTIIWLICLAVLRKNPLSELSKCIKKKSGKIMIIGVAISTLVSSFFYYKLPVSLISMLGLVVFPTSYLISQIKYKEKITAQMWIGTMIMIFSIVIFLM